MRFHYCCFSPLKYISFFLYLFCIASVCIVYVVFIWPVLPAPQIDTVCVSFFEFKEGCEHGQKAQVKQRIKDIEKERKKNRERETRKENKNTT